MECLERGDVIGVDGTLRVTKTGEKTVFVQKLHCLRRSPPPEKWHGLEDMETRLRRCHTDLIYSEGVLERMLKRLAIMNSIRSTLKDREFFEVKRRTARDRRRGRRPVACHPSTTRRYSVVPADRGSELHLKRLMVGGIERVYEMSRVFRNEGVDSTHNPEFTMIELYQAYGITRP
ncbi:MAG: amino acid--tRNA ligase-related protein [Planctomycetaceae bacterium]